jgi:hypothetical protein
MMMWTIFTIASDQQLKPLLNGSPLSAPASVLATGESEVRLHFAVTRFVPMVQSTIHPNGRPCKK